MKKLLLILLLPLMALGQVTVVQPTGVYTTNSVVRRDGTSNKVKNSGVIIDDSNNVSGIVALTMSGQLTSTVSTGTAPFVVASTTQVANLNAATAGSAGSATDATNIGITDDTSTNASMNLLWVTTNTGNLPAKVSSTKLNFNPSTGLLTVGGDVTVSGGDLTLTGTSTITGGAGNMTITSGTGASRTLTFRTTDSGSVTAAALTLDATQSATITGDLFVQGSDISISGSAGIIGGTGNMTITAGTGNSRTLSLRSTTAGSVATTFLTGDASQNTTLAGNLTLGASTSTITGAAGNMTIVAGTGNSRTMTLQTTTSGGTATNALVLSATQDATVTGDVTITGGDLTLTGTSTITGGAGNMTVTSGTGASRTMILRTTTAGSTATTALTLGADQSATFSGVGAFSGATASSTTGLILPVGTTALSSLRVPHGAAPSSPVNGDIWSTTTALFVRVNGSTVQLGNATPGGSDTYVQYNDGGVFGGDSGMTYNETTDSLTLVGSVTSGSGSGVAGIFESLEGTAPSLTANAFQIYAPADVAAGGLAYITPAAASSGVLQATNAAGVMTLSHSALTSGRVTFATTNGLLVDDSDLTFATDTLTATRVSAGNVAITVTATGSVTGSNAVDFSGVGFLDWTMTGNVTFTTSNLAAGKSVTLRLLASGGTRNLTFPGTWIFVGAAAPASLASGKYAILTLTSFSTTDANVVAAYSAQP